MAICKSLTAPLAKTCDLSAGGVKRIFIGNYTLPSYTLTNGLITTLTPDPTNTVTTTGTINNSLVAGAYVATTVVVTGDYTGIFIAGKIFKYTYNTQFGTGYWVGPALSSSYNAGTGKTTITPDYTSNFAPVLGLSVNGAAPNNTNNQTVSTYLFFEVATNKNVCNFQETTAIDLANGTTFFNQILTLVLTRREKAKRDYINSLIDGQKDLLIIVQDSNGIYWLMGLFEGAYVTGIDGATGVAKSDRNGYEITFTAMERLQAYEVQESAIASYLVTA